MSRLFQLRTYLQLSPFPASSGWVGTLLRALSEHIPPCSPHHSDWVSRSFPLRSSKDCFLFFTLLYRSMAAYGRGSFCAHASSTALNFHSDYFSCARCASTGTPHARSPSPHCQPVTSYPFSCKHRLTKFV